MPPRPRSARPPREPPSDRTNGFPQLAGPAPEEGRGRGPVPVPGPVPAGTAASRRPGPRAGQRRDPPRWAGASLARRAAPPASPACCRPGGELGRAVKVSVAVMKSPQKSLPWTKRLCGEAAPALPRRVRAAMRGRWACPPLTARRCSWLAGPHHLQVGEQRLPSRVGAGGGSPRPAPRCRRRWFCIASGLRGAAGPSSIAPAAVSADRHWHRAQGLDNTCCPSPPARHRLPVTPPCGTVVCLAQGQHSVHPGVLGRSLLPAQLCHVGERRAAPRRRGSWRHGTSRLWC